MLKQCVILITACFLITANSTAAHLSRNHPVQASQILKGPYLIYPNDNTQMTVLWQTDATSKCEIAWGLDMTYSSGNIATSEYGADHQHKYTIPGLVLGKKYYYRVTVGQNAYNGSFLAAPADNADTVKFLAYGDTRSHPDRQNQICGNIISTYTADPNCQTFIVHTGDWVDGNSEAAWASEFFNRTFTGNITVQANLPIQGCIGNHEASGTHYSKYWPYPYVADRYWSFDYGPVHMAYVDQYAECGQGSAQLTWLEKDLRSSTKPWKFIVFHEPGWVSGGFHGKNSFVQTIIQPLCLKYGVQIVFAGHNHYYARAVINGVEHLTIGTGGAPPMTPKPGQPNIVSTYQGLGYCKISISGKSLTGKMLSSPSNTVVDAFVITLP